MNDHAQAMTLSERADELEEHMMHELEHIVIKSALFNLADGKCDRRQQHRRWRAIPANICS